MTARLRLVVSNGTALEHAAYVCPLCGVEYVDRECLRAHRAYCAARSVSWWPALGVLAGLLLAALIASGRLP